MHSRTFAGIRVGVRLTRLLRGAAFVGPLVEAAAVAQQLAWHARHPTSEPFGNLLLAHSGIYAGAFVGALGAIAWLREPRWRAPAVVVLAGALVRVAALAWDARLHGTGREGTPAHDLYRVGIAVAAAGLGWASVRGLATMRSRATAARE